MGELNSLITVLQQCNSSVTTVLEQWNSSITAHTCDGDSTRMLVIIHQHTRMMVTAHTCDGNSTCM
jgi:hypothetical protein